MQLALALMTEVAGLMAIGGAVDLVEEDREDIKPPLYFLLPKILKIYS
jgi:hypothetical protein